MTPEDRSQLNRRINELYLEKWNNFIKVWRTMPRELKQRVLMENHKASKIFEDKEQI